VYSVYRTDGGAVRKVAQFTGVRSSHAGRWDGLVNGKRAPEGIYAFGVTVENRALVAGSWPHRLPPKDRRAAPHTGLTIGGHGVPDSRPFARGAPPAGFAGVAALVRFLDKNRMRYDLTTDLAFAHGRGPLPRAYRGVLFPGSERWITPTVGGRLRAYVEAG